MADTTTPAVIAGATTTEYKVAQKAEIWGIVSIVLGLVISIGSLIAEGFGSNTQVGVWAGMAITIAGKIQQTLTALGYIKSRTDVKVAASLPTTTKPSA